MICPACAEAQHDLCNGSPCQHKPREKTSMADIGEPQKEVQFEPMPEEQPISTPAAPAPAEQPDLVPA